MLTPPRACTLLGGTVLAAVLVAVLLPATAGAAQRAHPISRCEDLRGMTVAATAIGLPTSGARVTLAERAAKTPPYVDPYGSHMDGSHLLPTAAHCRVQGEIAPVDSAAPPIRFNVNLPLEWNGRAIQSGGGGLGGAITTAPKNKSSGRFDPMPLNVPYPLNKGYVTFGSDNGHKAGDLEFIKNDEALRNWGGNEIKKTHDVAQRIVAAAYGRPARHTFFIGESAGGREAMVAAQRFGGDYAGVIATSPILSWSAQNLAANNTRNHMVRGHLDAAAVKLLADHTRAACDAQDGLRDGIVATYLECRNDAIALRCPDGKPAAGCLSDDQVRTVNAIRDPYALPFALAHGVDRFEGMGVTGMEDEPHYGLSFYHTGTAAPSYPLPAGTTSEPGRGSLMNIGPLWIRHAITGDPAAEPYLFDLRPHTRRIQHLSQMFDATDPDLSALAAKNHKLILFQPSADNAASTPMVSAYYRSVVARMGKAKADKVMRFFVGSGGHHTTGPSKTDFLTVLEQWVLEGKEPPNAVTSYEMDSTTGQVLRSLPSCRYPMYARYTGGDPKSAAGFHCTARPDPLDFLPEAR